MSIILMGTIMGNGSVTLTTTVVAQPDGFFFATRRRCLRSGSQQVTLSQLGHVAPARTSTHSPPFRQQRRHHQF
ncbi:hypothetical protein DL744_15120 [Shigella dysenteriae]|nr:hypothetical protein [Shigella dysenteriae]